MWTPAGADKQRPYTIQWNHEWTWSGCRRYGYAESMQLTRVPSEATSHHANRRE